MHGKNDHLREELEQELRHLRALLHEVGEYFMLRQEGAIETIISNLDSVRRGGSRPGRRNGCRESGASD